MTRPARAVTIFLLCLPATAWARYGTEDPRLEKLFSTFISPCCWREDLTIHDSPIAEELRTHIRSLVKDGRSDDEIKAILIQEHTKRILTIPDGTPKTLLFWTPWLMAVAGLSALVFVLRRLSGRKPLIAIAEASFAELDDGWDLE